MLLTVKHKLVMVFPSFKHVEALNQSNLPVSVYIFVGVWNRPHLACFISFIAANHI